MPSLPLHYSSHRSLHRMDVFLLTVAAALLSAAALAVPVDLQHQDNEAAASDDNRVVDAAQSEHGEDAHFEEARHFDRRTYRDDNYENDEDIVYDFSYEVKDPRSGNDFGHRQSRTNGITQGQYRVLLPDGRMQVVDYVSDRDGFRPNIRYEDVGIAVFAGSENHEQIVDGTNSFDDSNLQQQQSSAANAVVDSTSELQRRRRRRR